MMSAEHKNITLEPQYKSGYEYCEAIGGVILFDTKIIETISQ